jgi:hypothetical protein
LFLTKNATFLVPEQASAGQARAPAHQAILGYSQELQPGRTAFVAELLSEQELDESQT